MCPGVQLRSRIVGAFTLGETHSPFPARLRQLTAGPAAHAWSGFSAHSPASVVITASYFSHPDRFAGTAHLGFNFSSLMAGDVEHLYTCLFAICVFSLLKCLCVFTNSSFLNVDFGKVYIFYIAQYIIVLCHICTLQIFSPIFKYLQIFSAICLFTIIYKNFES